MKKTYLLILLLCCFWASTVQAQSTTDGIQFFQGSWSELLAAAKSQKKPFFVDVYTTWCGPCKMMDKFTFSDAGVGKVSNKFYLAYKIDAEKGEGIKVAEQYKVNGYPTILFFSAEGKVLGREESYMEADQFIYVLEKFIKKAAKK